MSPVSNHRLLLVGDNDQVRRLIVSVLQREGFAVESAIDAAEVRHFLDTQPVDLIPLDLHMPGPADGEDLLFLLRDRGGQRGARHRGFGLGGRRGSAQPPRLRAGGGEETHRYHELVGLVRDHLPAN